MDPGQKANRDDSRRILLHNKLKEILGSDKVYFQPPESTKLTYPCIVYSLSNMNSKYSNNKMYNYSRGYNVTLLHTKPYNEIKDDILTLDLCKFERVYVSENIYHYVYTIYEI